MITLVVNPIVLAALQKAFPTPASSAQNCLAKYVDVLQSLLIESINQGQTPEQRKLKLYSLSTKRLRDEGPQIGAKKTRLHKWLKENKLELVKLHSQGNNLKGLVSEVKLTSLVTMHDALELDKKMINQDVSDREMMDYLDGTDASNQKLVHFLYPELANGVIEPEVFKAFHRVPVELQSLKNYIVWLSTEATLIKADQKKKELRQARIILGVATFLGWYLQRKKPSLFGRMYYEGVSVQNVSKELRRAMLGDCWEYDMRSAVIAWKMGFAEPYLAARSESKNLRKVFKTTLSYLEDKPDFMGTVRHFVFDEDSNANKDLQTKLLKQAITAISFGARHTTTGWKGADGSWEKPAIVDIIKNPDERKRFLNDATIRSFISEQNALDTFIFDLVKRETPELLKLAHLQTQSGRVSKSKVLAYRYQKAETEVMNVVRRMAKESGKTVIANVHDAIFLKQRLGVDLKSEIEFQMHEQTNNPYWSLAPKELKGFVSRFRDEIQEENEHRKRIAQEEAQARALTGKACSTKKILSSEERDFARDCEDFQRNFYL
jgi:hypothetical protein